MKTRTTSVDTSRRRFVSGAAMAASAAIFPASLCGRGAVSTNDAMDEALVLLARTGPEYAGGLSNHGPMAAEALMAMGREKDIIRWVERYKPRLQDYPSTTRPVSPGEWREALGDYSRAADWAALFNRELKETPWRRVLSEWTARLAPGLAAAAAHGLIRAAHAARSLTRRETPARLNELAEGLGYWAARYMTLPGSSSKTNGAMKPSEAISKVERLPAGQRVRVSILGGLRRLDGFAPFAKAIDLVDYSIDASRFISDITETFAALYLAHSRNLLSFLHGVTGSSAIRLLLPYVEQEARQSLLRYGWQMAAGIFSAFGETTATAAIETAEQNKEELIEQAVTNGDEHAIKFAEACLREHAINPKPAYLAAARHAVEYIRRS